MTDLNLNAYYYSFDPTGVEVVDQILAAVAAAGKAFHHTEWWNDAMEGPFRSIKEGQTPAEAIQESAVEAAEYIRKWVRP